MSETTQDRDARRELEAPGEVCGKRFGRLRCDWVLRHLYERGVDVAVAESVEAAFAVAAVVRRELDAPADRDALWRDYEEAREEFENSAKLYQFAGDSESLSDLARDRARLDAAVRALAAAPPAEPREREEA